MNGSTEVKKAKHEGLCNSPESNTSSFTKWSWLHIQYIQSDTHLEIYWWKVLLRSGTIWLQIMEMHVEMFPNKGSKTEEGFSFCR